MNTLLYYCSMACLLGKEMEEIGENESSEEMVPEHEADMGILLLANYDKDQI